MACATPDLYGLPFQLTLVLIAPSMGKSQIKSHTRILSLRDKDLNHVVKSQIIIFFEISNLTKANIKSSTTILIPCTFSIGPAENTEIDK